MNDYLMTLGVGLCILMGASLYRVLIGPTAIDRITGVNVIGTKTTVLLVIIGLIFDRLDMFIDIALAYALLNFIATMAAARFFLHHKELHPSGYRSRGARF